MQRLEVSGAVRPLYGSLGVKGLKTAAGVVPGRHLRSFWKFWSREVKIDSLNYSVVFTNYWRLHLCISRLFIVWLGFSRSTHWGLHIRDFGGSNLCSDDFLVFVACRFLMYLVQIWFDDGLFWLVRGGGGGVMTLFLCSPRTLIFFVCSPRTLIFLCVVLGH